MKKLFYKGVGWLWTVTLVVAVIISLVLAGCVTSGNHGSLKRSRDIDNVFLAYEVLPDHRYYTSGGYDSPNAILAIHQDYELVTDLWWSIPNVNSAQIRKWIDTISPEENYTGTKGYFGAYIHSPEGERVGVWYSIQSSTVIKFYAENKVEVYTPDLFQRGELFMGDGGDGNIIIR